VSLAEDLHACAVALADRCDGARALDEAGFSATDAKPGAVLAATPPREWDADTIAGAGTMLRKYRRQLAMLGLSLPWTIPNRAEPSLDRGRRHARTLRISFEAGGIVGRSLYRPADPVVEAIKRCPGKRWDPDASVWRIPHTAAAVAILRQAAADYPLDVVLGDLPDALEGDPDILPPGTMRAEVKEGGVCFSARYHPGPILDLVRELPGRIPSKLADGSWEWWAPASVELLDLLDSRASSFVGRVRAAVAAELESRAALVDLSGAAETAFQPAGLDPQGGLSPYPYQLAGVAYATAAKRAFIADEMGLGKSLQAIATVAHLDAWPVLIVCPAVVKVNWRREIKMWTGRDAVVLAGTDPAPILLAGADAVIINYEILPAWEETLIAAGFASLFVDESHRVKKLRVRTSKTAKATLRAAALYKIAKAMREGNVDPVQLLLTGTPIINMPSDLVAQLRIIDRLDDLGGWKHFTSSYCVEGHWGLTRGGKNLDQLNRKLREVCYVRRTKDQVLPELPEKRWAQVPFEIVGKSLAIYEAKLAELRAWARANDWQGSGAADALQRINACRQAMAAAKLPAAVEWIKEFLSDSDEKLVVFAHHQAVTGKLSETFEAPAIRGGISAEERQNAVDRFQNDPACRLIVCSIAAAGVGLTLTAASNVLFVESGWTPADMDQAIDRLHRIGQRCSVTGWQTYGELPSGDDSIDTWMLALIAEKREVVTAATDGESATSRLMRKILGADASDAEAGG